MTWKSLGGDKLTPHPALLARYDVKEEYGNTADGSSVDSLTDQTGNGNNLSGASQTLQQNQLNGNPTIKFDGTSGQAIGSTSLTSSDGFGFVVCIDYVDSEDGDGNVLQFGGFAPYLQRNQGFGYNLYDDSGNSINGNNDTARLISGRLNTNQGWLLEDGNFQTTTSYTDTAADAVWIGGDDSASEFRCPEMYFAELSIFPNDGRVLSYEERRIANNWGLTAYSP